MFTGLIEAVGQIVGVTGNEHGRRVQVATPLSGVVPGESISVSGVCVTATDVEAGRIFVDVGPETLRVTTLGRLVAGDAVNLERAMRLDGRFGGHWVQGHVDGMGTVTRTWVEGETHWLTIDVPAGAGRFLVPKGSVAVDGVSLTVATLGTDAFSVMIIPFTRAHTTLGARRVGDQVNVEYDIVGKYVVQTIERAKQTGQV
jgi:riboflavin synthase